MYGIYKVGTIEAVRLSTPDDPATILVFATDNAPLPALGQGVHLRVTANVILVSGDAVGPVLLLKSQPGWTP